MPLQYASDSLFYINVKFSSKIKLREWVGIHFATQINVLGAQTVFFFFPNLTSLLDVDNIWLWLQAGPLDADV